MTLDDTEVFINALIDTHTGEILGVLESVEKKAFTEIDRIDIKQDGNIVAPSTSLPQARAASLAVQVALSRRILQKTNKVIKDFKKIDRVIKETYSEKFNKSNKRALIAAAKVTFEDYNSITVDTNRRLNKSIIDYSVTGLSRDQLKTEVQGILTGHKDVRGVSMAVRSEQFTQDAIMNYHRTANYRIAKQIGIKRFKYFGNLINDSRPFCLAHSGQIKTAKEWEAIGNNQSWKGKSGSNIFVYAGGYNCRHVLSAVF